MLKLNDLSRALTPLNPDGTLIAVIEMSQSSWLVAGIVPGIERHPLKKLVYTNPATTLGARIEAVWIRGLPAMVQSHSSSTAFK